MKIHVVSPVYEYEDRKIVIVEVTPSWFGKLRGKKPYRQPFYQSSGENSKRPNKWLPFDGIIAFNMHLDGIYSLKHFHELETIWGGTDGLRGWFCKNRFGKSRVGRTFSEKQEIEKISDFLGNHEELKKPAIQPLSHSQVNQVLNFYTKGFSGFNGMDINTQMENSIQIWKYIVDQQIKGKLPPLLSRIDGYQEMMIQFKDRDDFYICGNKRVVCPKIWNHSTEENYFSAFYFSEQKRSWVPITGAVQGPNGKIQFQEPEGLSNDPEVQKAVQLLNCMIPPEVASCLPPCKQEHFLNASDLNEHIQNQNRDILEQNHSHRASFFLAAAKACQATPLVPTQPLKGPHNTVVMHQAAMLRSNPTASSIQRDFKL